MSQENKSQKLSFYFPRFSNYLNRKLSESDFNINSNRDFERICNVIHESLLKFIKINDSEKLNSTCLLLLDDIIELKSLSLSPVHKINCNYLQIFLSMYPIKFGLNSRMLQITHDWIVYSISDQVPYKTQTKFEPNRFYECLISENKYCNEPIEEIFIEWLGCYFYYSYSSGGLRELSNITSSIASKYIFDWYLDVSLGKKPISFITVDMIIHFTSLMNIVDKEKCKESIKVLENLLLIDQVDKRITSRIKQQLSCAPGQLSSRPTHEWAEEVLSESENELDELAKINTLISSFDYDINIAVCKKDLLISAIKQFILTNLNATDHTKLYLKARIFRLLNIPVELFIRYGYYEFAKEILSTWYGVSKLERKILFCLPNQISGPLFAMENGPTISTQIAKGDFREVVEITNDFLSRNNAVTDDVAFMMKEYSRPGIPNIELSEKFELKLHDYYMLEELNKKKEDIYAIGEALAIIPNLQHPIQALMLKYATFTLPISVTLKSPYKDRKIKKVLIWGAESLTSSLELNAIKKIFRNAEMEIDCFDIDITAFADPYCHLID